MVADPALIEQILPAEALREGFELSDKFHHYCLITEEFEKFFKTKPQTMEDMLTYISGDEK